MAEPTTQPISDAELEQLKADVAAFIRGTTDLDDRARRELFSAYMFDPEFRRLLQDTVFAINQERNP